MRGMKSHSRRENAGAIVFLAGFLLFIAGVLTSWSTVFYASVVLMAVGSWMAGGTVSVED